LPGKYEFGRYDIDEVREMRRRFELRDDDYIKLSSYAKSRNLEFSASVFDYKGLDLLSRLSPPYIKIASTDLNNLLLLRRIAEHGIKMILSTGMSSLADIEKSVSEILKTGFNDIVLMHCISVYPAQLRDCNLGFIDTLRSAFGFPVGFSDHTQSSIAACLSVTKGVSYIEKHFTLDRKLEGFDHAYAAEKQELADYIADVRDAETALSITPQKLTEPELLTRKRARRSLYASRFLPAGTKITEEHVLVVRPQNVMSADEIDSLIGKTLNVDLNAYSPFAPQYLKHD
jgi:sialic acid synthase SpsE